MKSGVLSKVKASRMARAGFGSEGRAKQFAAQINNCLGGSCAQKISGQPGVLHYQSLCDDGAKSAYKAIVIFKLLP